MDEKHVDPPQIQNTKHSEQTNRPTHPISISTHPVVTQYRYQACHYDSISTHPVGAMTNPGTSPSHPETLQVRWNVQRWRDGEPLGGSRCSLMMVSCTKTTHTHLEWSWSQDLHVGLVMFKSYHPWMYQPYESYDADKIIETCVRTWKHRRYTQSHHSFRSSTIWRRNAHLGKRSSLGSCVCV